MNQQGQHPALELFQTIAKRLNSKLKTQIKTFFLPLILGALLVLARRRTVTTWLRAAGLSEGNRRIFYHLPGKGHDKFAFRYTTKRLGFYPDNSSGIDSSVLA